MAELSYVHRFEPARPGAPEATVLALHGTGGDENDLLPLVGALAPGVAVLSPRGDVLENGMPRFFRRLAEGVFDEADLVRRTHALADFVESAAAAYGFDPARVYAVGYSNGANVAASLMLLRPRTLAGGVLFRAMPPLDPPEKPDLAHARVLLAAGSMDPIVPAEGARRLATTLNACGADVELHVEPVGHGLSQGDVDAARAWFPRVLR